MQQDQQKITTLDESIESSRLTNPSFKVSRVIVSSGAVLGIVAKLIYGREFVRRDPMIGPILGPLSFIWITALMHMFYVMVKIRLSRFTRIFCYIFFVSSTLFLGKILIVDWLSNASKTLR